MRLHFEEKLKGIIDQLNNYKSRLKLSTEDLNKLSDNNKELKLSSDSQNSSITFLMKEKIKLEKMVQDYQTESASLKEEILSKRAIITQRDKKLNTFINEINEANKTIQELKNTITDKDFRISLIQSKVMEKKKENDTSQAAMDKIKRMNLVCEERIKVLTEKLKEMTEKYNEVNTKYQPLVDSEKIYKEESETLNIKKCEAEKKIETIEEKYKGIETQYDNLKQEFESVKKDYNDSIQALEEINKSRNAYFADLQVKNEKLKVAEKDKKEFEKIQYNEQALIKRLQERVTELEDEYEKISRRETANSEMSAIQI
jgi:chromosome segregation ATPase